MTISNDLSVELDECHCSLIATCRLCGQAEQRRSDPCTPGGPAVPASYTATNDVNPVCGCHLRSQCDGCRVCTSCDGCYCGGEG